MKPLPHLTVSAALSLPVYCISHSAITTGIAFLSGFLIDIDHFIDYFREYGILIDRKHFFKVFHETQFNKLLIIFHAWEWVIILFISSVMTHWNQWLTGLLIGTLHHLAFDQCTNGVTLGGYFFIYRAHHQFSMRKIILASMLQRKRTRNHNNSH